MYFWLYDGTNTYSLDDNVVSLVIGGVNRNYEVKNFAGADGGYITGDGNLTTNTISFSRKNRLDSTSSTAWNASRNTLISWFTKAKTTDLYLRILNGEGTATYETKIKPMKKGDVQFSTLGITNAESFDFTSEWGYFQIITGSETTDTLAITGSTEQTLEVTNSGNIETPIECNFTPTGAESLFQVTLADSYGFRLEKTNFAAGVEIKYTTADGKLYFDDVEQKASQYLTAGSVFKIPPGTFNLYILCSGAGSFDYSFKARII
jgi:hypothetical protein